jgi:hypothetical protein
MPQETQAPRQMQTPREMRTPQETTQRPRERMQTSRQMKTPQEEAQMPQEAGIKKVSSEVSLQMSSRFASQQVPQKLTRHWPQHLTY